MWRRLLLLLVLMQRVVFQLEILKLRGPMLSTSQRLALVKMPLTPQEKSRKWVLQTLQNWQVYKLDKAL